MRRTSLLFAVLLAIPVSASAQSYAETVWTQLQATYEIVSSGEGDYELKNYVLGKLGDSETDTWTFPLVAGREYFLMAACDEDCSDIDLTVSVDGETVAADVETDDVPVLRFTPSTSGRHSIEVKMYECSAEPCYWGLGLFER